MSDPYRNADLTAPDRQVTIDSNDVQWSTKTGNQRTVQGSVTVAPRLVASKAQPDPSALTGDDVEAIIGDNGGLGEWEGGETVERWDFPRFAGADEIGTCEALTKAGAPKKGHEGEHTETDACVHWQVDAGNLYRSRAGIGDYESDVETLVGWMDAPRNIVGAIMLLGEPGTGKTALIEAAVTRAGRDCTTVVCTPDHTKDSLFLRFVGEDKGDEIPGTDRRSPYTLGPVPYAAKHGHVLYMDEFMLLVDGVKPLVYPLADGRRFLPEGNVDGSAMAVHPDFRIVFSSNPQVRGASLPEPVASRCASTTLTVETDAELMRGLGIEEEIVVAWQSLGNQGLWRPQIREMRVADYWLAQGSIDQCVSAFLPEHCPESMREKVFETVAAQLGGGMIRKDGRLVVS